MTGPRWVLPGYAAALSLAVLGPLLSGLFSGGSLLLRDAVSTPRSYLTDAALGLGEAAPRAVPQDVAVAVLSTVADGGAVVIVLLFGALLLAGWGAGRLAGLLLPEAGLPGQLVAATVAVWNPYVAERLLQGHWSLLLGYGCLPWVAAAGIGLRGRPGVAGWAALAAWTALAGLTPTGLILAAIVGLVASRFRPGVAAVAVLAALPWVTASLLGSALGAPQTAGLAPFAARAEPGLGTLGSLAGLGGIWNAEAVPPSRTTGFAVLGTVVLLVVVGAGAVVLVRRRIGEPLLILAAVSVLVPAVLATGPGLDALRALVDAVPGLAVLRDGQKWVALAMPGYALAGAAAVLPFRRAADRSPVETAPDRRGLRAALCCLALIAVLPDLSGGVWGRVAPVYYPPAWPAVAAAVNADPRPVAVLPADSMRRFAWAGPAPVLDPLPRWVRGEVLATGDLHVAGTVVAGEGTRARAVQRLLLDGADPATLTRAGVGWVVVEHATPGAVGESGRSLAGLTPAYSDDDLRLYRLGGELPSAPESHRMIVLAAHGVWAAMLLGGAALGLLATSGVSRPGGRRGGYRREP